VNILKLYARESTMARKQKSIGKRFSTLEKSYGNNDYRMARRDVGDDYNEYKTVQRPDGSEYNEYRTVKRPNDIEYNKGVRAQGPAAGQYVTNDTTKFANMPTEGFMEPYRKYPQGPQGYDDTIRGIDGEIAESSIIMKRDRSHTMY